MTGYTIISIPWLLVLFGIIYSFFVLVINVFIELMNRYISGGDVSMQFITYWNFSLALFAALPLFFIVVVSIWAYRRVTEKRGNTIGY